MNIVPKLNLNKHPKDCVNNSLVDANNVMFDVDQNVLCNDNKLTYNRNIYNYAQTVLANYYRINDFVFNTIQIVGSINCNKEIIYFVSYYIDDPDDKKLILIRENNVLESTYNGDDRYSSTQNVYLLTDPLSYHDGEIAGTFTYNRNNELIIAFSEYKEDNSLNEPLRTINLDDLDKCSDYFTLVPEVRIPQIIEKLYIRKPWYKGQNYVFISFKISEDTYTQWYDLHTNVYLDTFHDKNIINASLHDVPVANTSDDITTYNLKEKVYMSDKSDICDLSFALKFSTTNYYDYYRLAVVNIVKDTTRVFCSYDIESNIDYVEVTADLFRKTEIELTDIIKTYYNYYNVKEIENFKNKLFISNYKEQTVDYSDLVTKASAVIGDIYDETIADASEFVDSNPTYINANVEYYIKGIINNKNYYQLFKNAIDIDLQNGINNNTLVIDDISYTSVRKGINMFLDLIWALYPFTNNNIYVNFRPDINSITSLYINSISTKLLSNLSSAYRVHLLDSDGHTWDRTITTTNDDTYFPHSNIVLLPLTIQGASNHNWYAFEYNSLSQTFKSIIDKPIISFTVDGIVDANSNLLVFRTANINGNLSYQQIYYDTQTPTAADQAKAQLAIRTLIAGEYYQFYIHYVDKYGNSTFGFPITINNGGNVYRYYNKNGEAVYQIGENIDPNDSTKMLYASSKFRIRKLRVKNIEIPDGYVGWFISYAKFENTTILHGYRLQDPRDIYDTSELTFDDSYSAGRVIGLEIDILDKLNINANRLEYIDIATAGTIKKDDISLLRFVPSNSADNMFGTAYYAINYTTYQEALGYQHVRLKKVPIDVNDNKVFLYMNNYKELVPLNNVCYDEFDNSTYMNIVDGNYNGVISRFEAIYYKKRAIYDSGTGTYIGLDGTKLTDVELSTFVSVETWFDYSTYFNESKRYRSNPQIIVNGDYDKDKPGFTLGVILEARDVIDIFENNQFEMNEVYPKFEISYYKNAKYKYIFDKTIRRSNVIADESLENSWRKFETDQYINIQENKGNITNLCSIGNAFLVHTEHSLFQFDFNDRLTSNGGIVQVDQKDIFDSRYTELFNSELGLGGLQERRAAIAGDFGYIWYNNDFKHFYALSKEGPKVISEDIDNILKYINPHNIRFGDDKQRSRLLIRYAITRNDVEVIQTISFNYKLGCFVSMHDYDNPGWFAYTKDKIRVINNDKVRDGYFRDKTYVNCQFSIVCSTNYDEIKFLEYISYKFVRIDAINYFGFINTKLKPMENRNSLEPGTYLYVISDSCTTGQINLKPVLDENDNASNDYANDYPYYELGKYNLNKLINLEDKGRIFGNYFVFTFIVNSPNEKKINFENIDYSLTKIRR